ncbi:AMP-binding protein [Amycolatopsis sp. GM8]|uniref:AMP-binding protein n=1 Tax=Amycolatopsis sp. GM8 TaxID=2896530 RepID=UPI001F18BEBC|nr:AMP-binding protein [Amycolatopsis sp. GM8]
MPNVAQLLLSRREDSPGARLGLAGAPMTVADAVDRAAGLAGTLLDRGLEPGRPVALIGANSNDWLITWMACQLAALPTALINPSFPDDLLTDVLRPLTPQAVLTTDPRPALAELAERWTSTPDLPRGAGSGPLPGVDARASDLSAFMLTSGTSGPPKLVAQSHRYFRSLGRYVADVMGMTETDTVLSPLPLFHINPLGYAVLGALTARANCLSLPRFSASTFWPQVRDTAATVAILHGPPLEILKRRTTRADAGKHALRAVFYADPEFLSTFDIPLAVTVYGSTEAGGLCHTHLWRRDDTAEPPEGAVHYGGQHRPGLLHRISDDGEIHIRALEPGLLADGYVRPGGVVESFVRDGWFATGDLGYDDDHGGLVYLARASESVRVKGEFVPLGFVEDTFRTIGTIDDLALWKRPSSLIDEELVLFIQAATTPLEDIRKTASELPSFMRPSAVARLNALPRDTTVGKTRRRELDVGNAIEVIEL